MRPGFRTNLIIVGVLLVLFSWYLGDWAVWLGAPLAFLGIIFKYLERD